ncbi:MAG: DUF4157 domain-containing protein [Pseudomonadales bacterium]|nr:DUF4157 domain-containing protein [Pseudomonadales bacterium]
MATYAAKIQDNKSSVHNETFQANTLTENAAASQINRTHPEVVTQNKRQKKADNSPLSQKPAQLQAMADSSTQDQTIQRQENHTGLPDNLKSGIENLSGYSMNDVNVHYNSAKPAQLQAHAYAQGSDIHLSAGQEKHLPHEAWHVVQQKQGRVKPTKQLKSKININDDSSLEKEADVMGEKALSQGNLKSVIQPKPLNTHSRVMNNNNSPIQGKFGFEIEVPILLTHKKDTIIPKDGGGLPYAFTGVPSDAGSRSGNVDIHAAAFSHINVDHSSTLNPLVKAELREYGRQQGFDADGNAQKSLDKAAGTLFPHRASIMEVVTEAWDECRLTRPEALQKIRAVINWVAARYAQIDGDNQVAMGNYYIGSNATHADMFQPRLGYFHSTYGIKLSQVPKLFEKTTSEKDSLKQYADRSGDPMERPHANNLLQTFNSIATAQVALSTIKGIWPRTGGSLTSKGSKNWANGTEQTFLGFLTLLSNYLLMFKANNGGLLGKQMVGMHYYKSDLHDVVNQLPTEILVKLRTTKEIRNQVIAAIGGSVGYAPSDKLGGPMGNIRLKTYLEQLFIGSAGALKQDTAGNDIYDPLLARTINPYSAKLGPENVGPIWNSKMGVVMENRHLEYLDPNYGTKQDDFNTWSKAEYAQYGKSGTAQDKAKIASIGAREDGAAKRPITEWEDIMINIYDMIQALNK